MPETLGLVMEQARIKSGLTQAQLALLLGTSRWNYNRVVNGHAQFNPDWLRLLPQDIRAPVARYLQQRHDEERAALNRYLPEPTPLARLKEPPVERRIKRPTGAVAAVV